jgi:hypothetical protein
MNEGSGAGKGYTYTTLSSRPGEPAHIGVFFHLDERAWVAVCGAGSGRPHLSIAHREVSVAIAPCSPDAVTAAYARVARSLAGKAAAYAAALERQCAASGAGTPGTSAA